MRVVLNYLYSDDRYVIAQPLIAVCRDLADQVACRAPAFLLQTLEHIEQSVLVAK